ncbi:MAG: hypothetical protein GY869_28505, partial [Planctomycetes bacterium]|nr:hypothetical protein [Planctomycetota bacterium]
MVIGGVETASSVIAGNKVVKGMFSRWITFLALILFLGGGVFAGVQEIDTDPHAMGYRPPTEAELAWEYDNELIVEKVRLNRLGLERVQAARESLGLSALDFAAIEPAPFGLENVGWRRKDRIEASGIGALEEDSFLGDGYTADDLPRYVDNSTLKYFPPIRTQGSIGSCAQFSTIYYVMTHNTALARDWDAKSGGDDYRFSPKWSYNMVNGGADNGSSTTSGLYIAMYHGAARWSQFPYGTNGSNPLNYREWSLDPAVWRDAIDYRSEGFSRVYNLHTLVGRDELKAELNNGYVFVFCTNVSDWGYTTIPNDPLTTADDAFVGQQIVNTATSTSSNHCMTIAGYNDDIWCDLNSNGEVDVNEKGAFLIANSWGNWKNSGFVWFSYGILNYNVWSGNSASKIIAKPSYSPDMVGEFTLHQAKRNDLTIQIASSEPDEVNPDDYDYWAGNGRMIDRDGGAYAFDGTTTACSGTFVFDFTDLVPVEGLTKKFYLRVWDRYENEPAALYAYKLIDFKHGYQEIVCNDVPQTIDNGSIYASVLHAFMEDGSVVVDNQDDNTASSGSWGISSGPYPWAGESLYGEGTATFRWIPNIGDAGVYQVYAWWTALESRTTAAPYQISHLHGDSFVTVNQEINGGRWNKLGAYEFLAGSGGYVELSNALDGNSCADAIRLAPNKPPMANNQTVPDYVNIEVNFTLTGSDPDDDQINFTMLTYPEHGDLFGTAPNLMYRPDPDYLGSDSFTFEVDDNWAVSSPATVTIDVLPRTPIIQIIDNQDQNTESTGSWSPSTAPNPWAGESLYSSGAATFRWIPLWDLPEPVSYKVYTWWTSLSERGYNVPYRISHDQGITEIPVNQMSYGGDWHFLGNYIFSAGPGGYVEVSDTDTGNSCADAVKLVRNYGPVVLDDQALAFLDTLSPITLSARDQDDAIVDFIIISDPNHGELSGTSD